MSEQYSDPKRVTVEELRELAESGHWKTLSEVVVAVALYGDQSRVIEAALLSLAACEDELVRGNAVLGFGHLARRFGALSEGTKSVIESALTDESKYVRGQAWAAAEDVTHFLSWNVRGFGESV